MNLWIDVGRLAGAQPLFGIPPLERLRRGIPLAAGDRVVLSGAHPGQGAWREATLDASDAPLGTRLREALAAAHGTLVVLDGGNAVDPRLIRFLAESGRPALASRGEGARRAVALCLEASMADAIPPDATDLRAIADALLAAGRVAPLNEAALPTFIAKLRRSLPFWLYAVEDDKTRRVLERRLFHENYKGSTDLLTRWVFPPLVWPLTCLAARLRIPPNAITLLSIVLAFAAVPLWAEGHWFWGFVCAYAMAVLDSVDGKLARLTLTDTALGNVLDHGLDLVHPSFWYFAWAWGLGARSPDDPLFLVGVLLVVFYLGDRIVLGVAKKRLRFGLHAATVLDGRVRSVIARRNILMTVMAVALPAGLGAAGLVISAVWQALTLGWHGARTLRLGFSRSGRAEVESARGLTILPVESRAEMSRFIDLPTRLQADDPNYVAPLRLERRQALSPKSNPYFKHAEARFWLAVRDGRDVGRISAQVDRLEPDPEVGHFGFLAAEDDPEVFAALFGTAEAWLRERGKTRVTGPFSLSINEETGLLVDGFDTPPMLLMPHDPRYAGPRVEDCGYAKVKDVYAYRHDIRKESPPAVRRMIERHKPATLTTRALDMRRYDEEFAAITDIFNDAWSENWGFLPFTPEEVRHMAKSMKPLIRPEFVSIVESDGERVGFGIALPNLNEIIADFDGRLLPFNWLKLLARLKRGPRSVRVPLMGVRRGFGGSLVGGLVPFLIIEGMRQGGLPRGVIEAELSWILEDNKPMRRILDSFGATAYKTYRIYEKCLTTRH